MSANLRFSTNTVDGKKYLGGPLITGANGIFSTSATAANLVFDEVLKSENIAGTPDYRCLYLQNDFSNQTIYEPKLEVVSMTDTAKFTIGLLTDKILLDSLKLISDTTEHLSNTIDVFKDFLKEDKEKSLFNLTQNIQNNIALIETILNENKIRIDLDLDDEIYLFNFSNEFSQALINILNNASDAISSKLKQDELRLIKISTKQLKDIVEITILDNAGGIEKDIIEKIFEPYFTTKHKFQGTGLGLYMTHKIIKMSMKGKITVSNKEFTYEDKEYIGAEFKITLPSNT